MLLASALPPDVVLVHTSAPAGSSGQAEQIITQVAHPRVRGELREAGRALGFRV